MNKVDITQSARAVSSSVVTGTASVGAVLALYRELRT
jgi:hypothetical protein